MTPPIAPPASSASSSSSCGVTRNAAQHNHNPHLSRIWSAADVLAALHSNAQLDLNAHAPKPLHDDAIPPSWTACGVSIDSRSIVPGNIFLCLKGDKMDGHDYAAKAIENGAVAVIAERNLSGISPDKLILVEDSLKALEQLGRYARAGTGAKIIAVTGSVGKTGTRQMLQHAFAPFGQIHASQKSFNNHWGVPLTLCTMPQGSDFGIFEMGMNHTGEMAHLTDMVRPHVAIITNIAPVHMENFADGIEGIARAKAEIFTSMDAHGLAILNRDNAQYDLLSSLAKESGVTKIFSFGRHDGADARLLDCLVARNGTRVRARICGEDVEFTLRDSGEHLALNALSVLLAVKLLGYDLQQSIAGLRDFAPPAGRGSREYINVGDAQNPVTLIDESYNASPVAMEAAFKVMALIDPGRGGRRIAILGDMYELGTNAPQIHRDLALPLQAAGVDLVYTCGPLMKNLYDAIPEQNRGAHTNDSPELAQIVPDVLVPGDVVLIKGSRGGGQIPRMQMVVEALREIPKKWPDKMNDAANR